MAIYNLNYSKLESLLDGSYSPGTESAIIDAIKSAGIITPGSRSIGVDVVNTGGTQTVPSGVQIVLDTGAGNNLTLTTHGATLIAAGDGSTSVVDKGRGGDTLVGGAGEEVLKVTRGENLLIGGSGENTLIGGAGHDTLIGGGSSLLEAGSGSSTLIGGLLDQTVGDGRSDDQGRNHGLGGRDDRGFGGFDRGQDDGHGSHEFGSFLLGSDAVGHIDGRGGGRPP